MAKNGPQIDDPFAAKSVSLKRFLPTLISSQQSKLRFISNNSHGLRSLAKTIVQASQADKINVIDINEKVRLALSCYQEIQSLQQDHLKLIKISERTSQAMQFSSDLKELREGPLQNVYNSTFGLLNQQNIQSFHILGIRYSAKTPLLGLTNRTSSESSLNVDDTQYYKPSRPRWCCC